MHRMPRDGFACPTWAVCRTCRLATIREKMPSCAVRHPGSTTHSTASLGGSRPVATDVPLLAAGPTNSAVSTPTVNPAHDRNAHAVRPAGSGLVRWRGHRPAGGHHPDVRQPRMLSDTPCTGETGARAASPGGNPRPGSTGWPGAPAQVGKRMARDHPSRRVRDRTLGLVGHCGRSDRPGNGGWHARADSNTPAAGRPGRSRRPGFTYEIRLVGGEAGRRLEREQAEAIAEALGWLAANPDPAPEGVSRAGGGSVRPVPAKVGPRSGRVGWPYALEVRVRAVGPVGVGRPVREVAGLVGCIQRRCAAGSARPRGGGQTWPTRWTPGMRSTRTRIWVLDRNDPAVPILRALSVPRGWGAALCASRVSAVFPGVGVVPGTAGGVDPQFVAVAWRASCLRYSRNVSHAMKMSKIVSAANPNDSLKVRRYAW